MDSTSKSKAFASGLFTAQLQNMLPWVTMITETELCSVASDQYLLRICQLGIELTRQPASALRYWHQHYRDQPGLPTVLENQLGMLRDNFGQRRAYWQLLQSWMLEQLP